MTINLTKRSALIGAALSGMLAFTATTAAAEWRGWNIHVEEYPVTLGMAAFLAEVTEKTGGELTGTLYNNGVLGDQPDAIEQTRLGIIDFGEFSLGPMGQSIPETNVVSLPFIFKSIPQM